MFALMYLAIALVYLGIAWLVIRRLPSKKAKWIAVAFLVLIPTGDEILGRIYFRYLCETEAGVKVYQTVELPGKYWDDQGRARFYENFDSLLGKTYSMKYKPGIYSSLFHIDNAGYTYANKQSGQLLGEAIDFRHWGGWVRRNLSPHKSATSCIDYSNPSNRLIDRIFIPEHSKSK
jgi:hypothetical protein